MSNITKIKISGTSYDIKDENACKVVELTQAQYDALPASAKTSNSLFVITDATAGDLSNYYTKSETSGATEISTALNAKADTATTYTKTEVDNAITAATSTKQDTLVSGTNIKTINNESIIGSGNINIQGGGGKAIEAGRGITITTGETADTVSFNLPISGGGSSNLSVVGGRNTSASFNYSFVFGDNLNQEVGSCCALFGDSCKSNGSYTFAGGWLSEAKTQGGFAYGMYVFAKNIWEHSVGRYNNSVSASTTFGDSGNTLFSVGNGTSNSARHNAFEIRQNGDIYLTKDGQDVKLQDQLGGGSSYTAGDGIDITNDVISVTGKVDTSTYETYTAATDTALASKQTTLTAGTGISIVDNVISATGGTSITIDPSLDSGSTNPVTNSAITNAIDTLASDKFDFVGIAGYTNYNELYFGANNVQKGRVFFSKVNGNSIVSASPSQMDNLQLVETSSITTSISSSSTDTQVPSAKAVYEALQEGGSGGGGMTEDDELLLSTALTDLNDRKIDASEVKENYQRKGDYVTTSTLNTRLAEYETALDEQNVEEVTAYALNDLNNKFGGLSLVKITESEYSALATKDENILYIVVADPSQTR